MMPVNYLSAVGIGFVWGWMIAYFYGPAIKRRPFKNIALLILATLLLTLQLLAFVGRSSLPFFAGALIIAILILSVTERQIRKRRIGIK
jgi:hypothetical protein